MLNRSLAGVSNIDADPINKTQNIKQNVKVTKQEKGGKFVAASRVKKEVEQNPFKTLIDISDLLEMEDNPREVEKEVQNILLRYNSELKKWYKYYSRKVEHVETEESFALTLR